MSGTQIEWVGRVLGYAAQGGGKANSDKAGGGKAPDWPAIKDAWLTASETVDGQIGQLRQLLLGANDKSMQEIAEYGLNAMTGGYKVPMLTAMRAMDQASDTSRASVAAKVSKAAAALRAQLLSDPRVAACDACPHVKVSIAATLGGALAEMQAALGRLGGGAGP